MQKAERMNPCVNPSVQQRVPASINADEMTITKLRGAIMVGYQEMVDGNVEKATTAFACFRDQHK
ncbi:MAG: hypothetical protein R3Y53_07180 [Bacillota bacterium]